MFLNKELYFSNILRFNDPFECNPAAEYKPAELRKYFEEIARKRGISVSSKDLSNLMKEYKEKGFQNEYQKYLATGMGLHV